MLLLRRLLRYGNSIKQLNRTRERATIAFDQSTAALNQSTAALNQLQPGMRELFELVHTLTAEHRITQEATGSLSNAVAAMSANLVAQSEYSAAARRSADQRISAISATIDMLSRPDLRRSAPAVIPTQAEEGSTDPKLSLLLENFYVALEARFRGATGDIAQRQTVYLPDIELVLSRVDSKVVLDVGCGRGEWLSLLRNNGIEGIGVDSNEGQLAEARRNGLAVQNRDGLQFLREQPEGSFAAVTAFHIFEHMPFGVLAQWMLEIRRVLAPGGILIAETPNPENLIVGANTFHLDPTHNRPLPSGILAILAETVGLAVKQVRPLHPHGDLAAALRDLPERTAYLLYGYQDYGLIAERPKMETL